MKVGEKDTAGNMLRRPGPKASIFRSPDEGYLLKTADSSVPYLFVEDVLAAYNELNGTNYKTLPKFLKRLSGPERFPSSRNKPGKEEVWYQVDQLDSGTLICNCPGFGYRNTCKHVEFLEDQLSEKEQSLGDT